MLNCYTMFTLLYFTTVPACGGNVVVSFGVVRDHSKSLEITPFHTAHTNSY